MLGLLLLFAGGCGRISAISDWDGLPGDIVVARKNMTLYFPLMTCLLVSVLLGLVLWVVSR